MDPTIFAYISIPEDPSNEAGSDWFNLVLFEDRAFFDRFEQSSLHRKARETLSGESFTDVCERRGKIQNGVETSQCVALENSVLITYSDEAVDGMIRNSYPGPDVDIYRQLQPNFRIAKL